MQTEHCEESSSSSLSTLKDSLSQSNLVFQECFNILFEVQPGFSFQGQDNSFFQNNSLFHNFGRPLPRTTPIIEPIDHVDDIDSSKPIDLLDHVRVPKFTLATPFQCCAYHFIESLCTSQAYNKMGEPFDFQPGKYNQTFDQSQNNQHFGQSSNDQHHAQP